MKKIILSITIFFLLSIAAGIVFFSQQNSSEVIQEAIQTTQDTIDNRSRPDPSQVPVSIQKLVELNIRTINSNYSVLNVSLNAYQSYPELKRFVDPFIPNFETSNEAFADILYDKSSQSYIVMTEIVNQLHIVEENNRTYWVYFQNNILFESEPLFRNSARLAINPSIYQLPSYRLKQLDFVDDAIYLYLDYGIIDRLPVIVTIESITNPISSTTIISDLLIEYNIQTENQLIAARAEAFFFNDSEYYNEIQYSFEYIGNRAWLITVREFVDIVFLVRLNENVSVVTLEQPGEVNIFNSVVTKCVDEGCWIGNLVKGNFTLCDFEQNNCAIKRTLRRDTKLSDVELHKLLLVTNNSTDSVLYMQGDQLWYQDMLTKSVFE